MEVTATVQAGIVPRAPYAESRPIGDIEKRIYRCYLSATGLPDLELTIATIQTRMQLSEAGLSYFTVTVSNGLDYIDDISARAGGTLHLWGGPVTSLGVEVLTEIMAAPLTGVTDDEGARRGTVTLTARAEFAIESPKRVEITKVHAYRDTDGVISVTGDVDEHLRPGDVAVYLRGEFIVQSVVILESAQGLSRMIVGG